MRSHAREIYRAIVTVGAMLSLLLATSAATAEESAIDWLTGSALERRFESTIGLHWEDNPLRSALSNLSRTQRVALFIDRRVDPDRLLTFESEAVPYSELLDRITENHDLGWCRVGPVVYIGPAETTLVLATVVALREQEVEQLPQQIRASLSRTTPCRWEVLSEPRTLIEQLVEDYDNRVFEVDTLPHDLWPEVDLPDLSFAQQLSILLAGFGRTFEFAPDGSAVRPAPMPESATLERRYPGRQQAGRLVTRLREIFPDLEIDRQGNEIIVVGRWEEHQLVRRALSGQSVQTAPTPGESRYTLRVDDQQVGPLLETLARQLDLEIRFDPSAEDRIDRRVSFSVTEATLDELLGAATDGAGLLFVKEGDTLIITAKGEEEE